MPDAIAADSSLSFGNTCRQYGTCLARMNGDHFNVNNLLQTSLHSIVPLPGLLALACLLRHHHHHHQLPQKMVAMMPISFLFSGTSTACPRRLALACSVRLRRRGRGRDSCLALVRWPCVVA